MAKDIVLTKSPYFKKVLKNNFPQKESKSILIKNGKVFFISCILYLNWFPSFCEACQGTLGVNVMS